MWRRCGPRQSGPDILSCVLVDWALVGAAATVAGVIVAMLAWLRPRAVARRGAAHERLTVEVANQFPVFDRRDGSSELGGHLVAVTARNGTPDSVKAVGFGLRLPGERRMVARVPATAWEPRLPHWIQPSGEATWYFDAEQVRQQGSELGCSFDEMRAYVSFADGREVSASRGVPLA